MKILINLTTLGFSYVDLVNRQGHNYALVRLSNYSLITVICISLCELFLSLLASYLGHPMFCNIENHGMAWV